MWRLTKKECEDWLAMSAMDNGVDKSGMQTI